MLSLRKMFSKGLANEHDQEGIFLAYGSNIAGGKSVDDISIQDICPTIFHLLGCSVPGYMDGGVIEEIFRI
jgi:predicted AlkP superfamily phosphohydrolase/phosphomutase